jgi:uncharacterized protein (DUF302 family)
VQETAYGLKVELPVGYEEAVERATAALKTEGFGVLTTIDVRATIRQKLDKDFRKYVILGACNPPIAYEALSKETDLGLLLPCNVIVYENGAAGSVVATIAPLVSLSRAGNADLAPLGEQVDAKLRRVLASLETTEPQGA